MPPTLAAVTATRQRSIVLVEDDHSVAESLTLALGYHGYSVTHCADGLAAEAVIVAADPDLVVLDVSLPGRAGWEICAALRADAQSTPVLMLTARHGVADRVRGLDAGADDYLPKPFALEELLARVRALMRRRPADSADEELRLGGVTLDPRRRTASRNGGELSLTKIEFDLLELLLRNEDLVVSRATIYDRIWGYDETLASNSLEVFVSSLRRKLERDEAPRMIHTVRGIGYVARCASKDL